MIYEVHIKDHLTQDLLHNGSKNIVHEVGVVRSNISRIDVLDFTNEIHGYEIKTAVDSVSRLPQQVIWYGKVLDRITLVAATKHLKKALTIIPSYWGVQEIVEIDGFFSINKIKEAEPNPEQDKMYYASLLWADELKEILKKRGFLRGLNNRAHWNMANRLSSLMSIDQMRSIVCDTMRARNGKNKRNDGWNQQILTP
jgi:hypothetical protein